ncbi:MAG TPA: FAD:protein FMN transferase [Mobilitalea sp.]|nr:FAD:protein FMN transferase [Mobilitalea sp.]
MEENTSKAAASGIKQQFEALGTLNTIMIYKNTNAKLLQDSIHRVMEIDNKMSVYKQDSEITKINLAAGNQEASISDETMELISLAKEMSKQSDGAFDITIGPLARLWGIGKSNNSIPLNDEIMECCKLVNYQDIMINRTKKSILLKKQNQSIDLGGIAKGYAADEVKRILVEGGADSALINLGGNIITIGRKPDKKSWRIGIQNPLAPRGEYVGYVLVENQTIVTSGSNERFFIKNGIRYHHLLDPLTGSPAQSGLLSVTVICESSVIADALTTALFILGMEKGISLLGYFQADAVFLTEDGGIFITDGLKEKYQSNC